MELSDNTLDSAHKVKNLIGKFAVEMGLDPNEKWVRDFVKLQMSLTAAEAALEKLDPPDYWSVDEESYQKFIYDYVEKHSPVARDLDEDRKAVYHFCMGMAVGRLFTRVQLVDGMIDG